MLLANVFFEFYTENIKFLYIPQHDILDSHEWLSIKLKLLTKMLLISYFSAVMNCLIIHYI